VSTNSACSLGLAVVFTILIEDSSLSLLKYLVLLCIIKIHLCLAALTAVDADYVNIYDPHG
jgi:hypothetical protein